MKKVLLVCFALLAFSMQGFAQKGMQGFGLNLAGNVNEGIAFGGGVKYQYNLSNYVRLEPSFSYYSVDRRGFDMAGLVNLDLFFLSPRSCRPYFFVGPGFISFKYYHFDGEGDFGVNTGLGLDFRVSHNFSLQLEVGGIIGVSDENYKGGKFNLGFCYNF